MGNGEAFEPEIHRTVAAGLFLLLGMISSTTALAMTHELMPSNASALPDAFFSSLKYQPWGLDASESILSVQVLLGFLLLLCHEHRWIALRRTFFLMGIHYYYRAITMVVTNLPTADVNYYCAPKGDEISFKLIVSHSAKLVSGLGLSANGNHVYCGDYIYSGHTMTLVTAYLVVNHYSPSHWSFLPWLSLLFSSVGIFCLLASRGHYSVDVLIAYWMTTRLFWLYHTIANHPELLKDDNLPRVPVQNVWWWPIIKYLEQDVGGRHLANNFRWTQQRAEEWLQNLKQRLKLG